MTIIYDIDYSQKYYFNEFGGKSACLAHAKYKESAMKEFWGEKFVSSKILEGPDFYQVQAKYILRKE